MNSTASSAILCSLHDDGLITTAAEPWFKVKVQLIQQYFHSFVTNVSGKVDDIIFVDLFSGSGIYSIGHKKELFAATCLASLQTHLPVTKWIFCEHSSENSKALKVRVNKYFKGKNVVIVESRLDQAIDKFRSYVPQSKGSYKVAVFCLVDPFSIDIPFTTIDSLNDMGFSFLIPYNFSLNNRLDYKFYIKEQRDKLTKYLGGLHENFKESKSNHDFYKRVVRAHQNNILMLGLNTSLSVHKLDSGLMEMPYYYMGFASRQLSPKVVRKEVLVESHHQLQLFH
ncbi:MAG TPA: three-Cys-motif partner protein TcmP [Cyclobacteriaceae bacterium]|nr:three-Cys-motif partner protein TcmP [Cyclobacteriaceae bacterium]